MDPDAGLSSRLGGKDLYAVEMDLFADQTAYGFIVQWTHMQLSSRQYTQLLMCPNCICAHNSTLQTYNWQCSSVVHNLARYHCSGAQCRSSEPRHTDRQKESDPYVPTMHKYTYGCSKTNGMGYFHAQRTDFMHYKTVTHNSIWNAWSHVTETGIQSRPQVAVLIQNQEFPESCITVRH